MSSDFSQVTQERLVKLGIREEDLEETFVRSGGHGGQNVNKVSSCVILVHRPSGISIRCESERSQAMNRVLARHRLADRLEHREADRKARARHAAELIRRQKRRPSHAARRRNVENKRHHSEIKKNRSRPRFDE